MLGSLLFQLLLALWVLTAHVGEVAVLSAVLAGFFRKGVHTVLLYY